MARLELRPHADTAREDPRRDGRRARRHSRKHRRVFVIERPAAPSSDSTCHWALRVGTTTMRRSSRQCRPLRSGVGVKVERRRRRPCLGLEAGEHLGTIGTGRGEPRILRAPLLAEPGRCEAVTRQCRADLELLGDLLDQLTTGVPRPAPLRVTSERLRRRTDREGATFSTDRTTDRTWETCRASRSRWRRCIARPGWR